jgi:4-hydroxybenzoate polyprenyltransferase
MNSVKDKFLLLIKVSTPVGWGAAPAVFLIGLIASGSISGTTTLIPLAISQILLLSVPYCIFLFGINDVYDYETDKINPRKGDLKGGFIEGIKLEPEYHSFVKHVAFLVISLLLLTSVLTLSVTNVLGMLLLVFFSYFYSAPPLRFKERPPLDSFSNGMLYFFAPFLLGFSVGGGPPFNIPPDLILITACVMGIHAYSTIIDYDVDKEVGVKTFATAFGERGAALFAFLTFILSLFFATLSTLINPSPSNPLSYHHWFYAYCVLISGSLLFFITLVFPSRKIAKLFFSLLMIVVVVAVVLYVYTSLTHF